MDSIDDDDHPPSATAGGSPSHADAIDPSEDNAPGAVQLTGTASRRPPGSRKKKPHRKLAAEQKKLEALRRCLRPVPFSPGKPLAYFARHERLLRRLGLWGFASLDFDSELRADYIASLVACYDSSLRASTVGNVRVKVSRPDLARALRIPLKKDRSASETLDANAGAGDPVPDNLSVVKDFMLNWIFVNSEDTLVIPDEITAAARLLDSGQPEKIDWAALVWFMAEKELSRGAALSTCYYASHFQMLIRSQRPELFDRQEEPIAAPVTEAAGASADTVATTIEEVVVEEEEDGAPKFDTLEMEKDSEGEQEKKEIQDSEINRVVNEEKKDDHDYEMKEAVNEDEKTGGQDCDMNQFVIEEDQMVVEDEGDEEVDHQPLLRSCTSNEVGRSTVMSDKLDEMEFRNFEQLPASELILSMEGDLGLVGMPAGESIRPGPSETDHISVGINLHLDQQVSTYTNGCKREFEDDDQILHDEGLKKMRNDHSQWDNDFNVCMNQIKVWMNKAREIHTVKHESLVHAHLNLQDLDAGVRERDQIINALQANQYKMNNELSRLRFELYATVNLAQGYKRLLEDTRKAFSEYRRLCPQLDEPLFKDVSDGGGLVLTSEELAKHLFEREQEAKASFQRWAVEKIDEFSEQWEAKFNMLQRNVHLTEELISNLEGEFKLLKDRSSKSRVMEGRVGQENGTNCQAKKQNFRKIAALLSCCSVGGNFCDAPFAVIGNGWPHYMENLVASGVNFVI